MTDAGTKARLILKEKKKNNCSVAIQPVPLLGAPARV